MEVVVNFDSARDLASAVDFSSMTDLLEDTKYAAAKEAIAIAEILKSLDLYLSPEIFRKEFVPNTTGLFFDIGLVCSGIPECWVTPKPAGNTGAFPSIEPEDERKVYKLGLNTVDSYLKLNQSEVIERRASLLVLAYLLQQSGRPVEVIHYSAFQENNYNLYGSVVFKHAYEELDFSQLNLWRACSEAFQFVWDKLMLGVPKVGALGNLKKVNVYPITDYGKIESDVFVSEIHKSDKPWSREDSLNWVLAALIKLNINH